MEAEAIGGFDLFDPGSINGILVQNFEPGNLVLVVDDRRVAVNHLWELKHHLLVRNDHKEVMDHCRMRQRNFNVG
ncbi:hypothetical protein FH972_005090 [Carpinus fangiana]|uniref:Uncharacterized protein n=1 Tax=Carpinus fangiana TaxID=176857 RepID=A0A5N6QR18_9ROSI|nr:hypothetical protein FH972_005090 [Carpinus fangiana]